MKYYSYMWLREDGTPYYVGAGCGRRAFTNNGHTCYRPKAERILIFPRESWDEAIATEKKLISNWGRKDLGTGCLYNFTNGGDGQVGRKCSAETRKKLSLAAQGKKNALGYKHTTLAGTSEQLREWGLRGAEAFRRTTTPEQRHAFAVRAGNCQTPEQKN